MFILSYFRKKQTIKVKENTLDHLDDDFIVISDTLNNTSIEENCKPFSPAPKDKKENVKTIDIVDELKINNNTIEYVNEENNDVNYDTSFSDSRQGSLFETSSSLRSQRRDEENQLIENTKDNHKKLSFCDKIMNTLSIVYQIFNEKMERTYHK
jgi:hypothetical protein